MPQLIAPITSKIDWERKFHLGTNKFLFLIKSNRRNKINHLLTVNLTNLIYSEGGLNSLSAIFKHLSLLFKCMTYT